MRDIITFLNTFSFRTINAISIAFVMVNADLLACHWPLFKVVPAIITIIKTYTMQSCFYFLSRYVNSYNDYCLISAPSAQNLIKDWKMLLWNNSKLSCRDAGKSLVWYSSQRRFERLQNLNYMPCIVVAPYIKQALTGWAVRDIQEQLGWANTQHLTKTINLMAKTTRWFV